MLNDQQSKEVIALFGEQNQIIVAIEELAELQQELTKSLRKKEERFYRDDVNILAEIADVTIMLKQLMVLYEFNQTELDKVIEFKLARLRDYIEEVQNVQ